MNMPGSTFFCFAKSPDLNVIAGNDVLVVQRQCTQEQFNFLGVVRKLGVKIIYDLDDDVWHIPEENPAHAILTPHGEGYKACIRAADVVTTSTKTLARTIQKSVGTMVNCITKKEIPIVVAPNLLDPKLYATPLGGDGIVIGWAGSSSHVGDVRLIEPAMAMVAEEYPNVIWEFRGMPPPADMVLPTSFRHRFWTPVAEFGARMPTWGWSIALAPLTDHQFNAAKSPIKMIEAGWCGIPCLASWVKPYVDFTHHDEELRWLLCAGQSVWARKLRELINDPARRADLGQRARAVVQKHYTYSGPHKDWDIALAKAKGA